MVGTTILILEVCASDEMITKLLNFSLCGLGLQNFISLLKKKEEISLIYLLPGEETIRFIIGYHVPAVALVIDTRSSY